MLASATTLYAAEAYGQAVALDAAAARIIPAISAGNVASGAYNVCDARLASLGTIPFAAGGAADLLAVNPQRTRAYLLVSVPGGTDNVIRADDISATMHGGADAQLGADLPITGPSSATKANLTMLRGALTPDGGRLFVAGDAGIAVVPNLP
jgi:hypothetical protein